MSVSLDIKGAKEKIDELERLSGDASFWDNPEESQKVLQQIKALRNKVEGYEKLSEKYDDILTLCEMGNEEEDESLIPEARQLSKEFVEDYERLKISILRLEELIA